jgi:Protein of unknown function (DUF4240)/Leucine rich repeat/Leucine Rich repeat
MTIPQKTVKFPHRRSIGSLFVADESQPEEWQLLSQVRGLIVTPENQPIKWEWLEEARANVDVPAGKKLKLKMSGKGSGSLAPLADIQSDDLHTLDLSRSEITDISLSHIEHLSGMKVLELTSTNITDAGLIHLKALTSLQGLGLSHCHISGHGISDLASLQGLRELWMSGADLSDAELEHITVLNNLVQLGLSGTKITNEGLMRLAKIKSLVRLYVFNTAVTKEGTEKLRELSPNCRAKWKPAQAFVPDDYSYDDTKGGDDDFLKMSDGLRSMLDLPIERTPSSSENGKFSEDDFWRTVELLDWTHTGEDEAVIEPAVEALCNRSEKDITAFADILSEKLHRLDGETFAKEIGKDAYKGPEHRFARNWFLRVRCCVVANGSEYFQEVLAEPENMPKDLEFEAILRVAAKAYERKTGRKLSLKTKYNYETFGNKHGWAHH